MSTKSPYGPKRDHIKELADKFIEGLSKEGVRWMSNWSGPGAPMNPVTGKRFRGINWFSARHKISTLTTERGKEVGMDPRFVTFNQAKDRGWKVKAGAKAVTIVFYKPFVPRSKNAEGATPVSVDSVDKRDVRWMLRTFSEFHASDIEGIPALSFRNSEADKGERFKTLLLLEEALKSTGLVFAEDAHVQAPHYAPGADRVVMPPSALFTTDEHFWNVKLHEIAHATGAQSRIGRDLEGHFGDNKYAREELIAELASVMLTSEFGIEYDPERMTNNQAYVASWCRNLTDKPGAIYQAARDAQNVLNFCMNISIKHAESLGVLEDYPALANWKTENTVKVEDEDLAVDGPAESQAEKEETPAASVSL